MKKLFKFLAKHPEASVSISKADGGYFITVKPSTFGAFGTAYCVAKPKALRGKRLADVLEAMLAKAKKCSKADDEPDEGHGKKASMPDKCANCGAEIDTTNRGEVHFIERHEDKSRHLVSKTLVCRDCLDKAEVAVAEWADMPDWD